MNKESIGCSAYTCISQKERSTCSAFSCEREASDQHVCGKRRLFTSILAMMLCKAVCGYCIYEACIYYALTCIHKVSIYFTHIVVTLKGSGTQLFMRSLARAGTESEYYSYVMPKLGSG